MSLQGATASSETEGSPRGSMISVRGHQKLLTPFTRSMSAVEYRNLRFIILDCPHENNLQLYLEEFKNRNVTDVVRVCEPSYSTALFEESGIRVHDWPFKDGGVPPQKIVSSWLSVCDERFCGLYSGKEDVMGSAPVIAVHCVAGLGRAPVLVAIALIESGMPPLDAVEFIRQRRRGAINSVQLRYLVDNYKRQGRRGTSMLGSLLAKKPGSPVISTTLVGSNSETSEEEGNSHSIKESLNKMFRFKKSQSEKPMVTAVV